MGGEGLRGWGRQGGREGEREGDSGVGEGIERLGEAGRQGGREKGRKEERERRLRNCTKLLTLHTSRPLTSQYRAALCSAASQNLHLILEKCDHQSSALL